MKNSHSSSKPSLHAVAAAAIGISILVLCSMLVSPGAEPGGTAYGFGDPEHSKVSVAMTPTNENLEFVFKIEPNSDMSVTFDAPWTLEIKKADGLSFPKDKLSKEDLDEKIPGFKVATNQSPTSASGEIEYKLTSFICTKDKTRCYREVHKGKHNWAKK